jgi:hypothetical protein
MIFQNYILIIVETLSTFYLVVLTAILVLVIIGLYGILKEKERIIIFLTVLLAIRVFSDLSKDGFGSAMGGFLVTILHGSYAKMIFNKKLNPRNENEESSEPESYNYEKVYDDV